MQARITLFALGIVSLAGVALYPTLQFPSSAQVSTFIGPRVWPLTLIVVLLVLGVVLLALTWRDRARAPASDEPAPQRPALVAGRFRHWWFIAAAVGYTLLMQSVGFLVASLVFTLLGTLLLGARSWVTIVITLIVAAALMQGVFVTLLGIPMP
ncbi:MULTISPECIES: tripartite tricarboxylate transporter TctB family protein [unclassified Halomonas]|uniref:tripartite tricarboxylate transporter TctB family protein n=1 Tax=unclassified Halomonas TaxID=2609666 RepID=UPI0020A05B31|nr:MULTISPECIES: tripartite tricarboxylate transporter TctB family protein [unclassified Halomonas]MCP1313926.1 tripartite tricarboxylate transporter TctB family protein [Halomonas sp. 707D7]MCP1325215.1 tripartite tricarboxylate transporter TctB family protein [Halomonas sp. 707D4]